MAHHTLDVLLEEDDIHVRNQRAARVLAEFRKVLVSWIGTQRKVLQEKSGKVSRIPLKRVLSRFAFSWKGRDTVIREFLAWTITP